MILIGLGANLSGKFGSPEQMLLKAMEAVEANGDIRIVRRSSIWISSPVPASDQPWYRNAVAQVDTDLGPEELLDALQAIESDFGRVRSVCNAPRVIDLDLLAYNEDIIHSEFLDLPHPRMHERAFVLLPLSEIAPEWRHPKSGRALRELIAELSVEQKVEPLLKFNPG